jgi:uncharacterized membrane protein HdeD (DUF308 family)
MTATAIVLISIVGVIALLGGVGAIAALFSMGRHAYRD